MKVKEGECDRKVASYCNHFDEDVGIIKLLEARRVEATPLFGDE